MRGSAISRTFVTGVLGCIALAARPAAVLGALTVDVAVGLMGFLGPVPPVAEKPGAWPRWAAATVLGVITFVAGRLLSSPHVPTLAFSPVAVAVPIVASVAEEAFFRRWLYSWFAVKGSALAVIGTAAAFAVVHAPIYGVRALPIDFAAGVLFGWQRLVTGGWSASAVTHVAANLLQMR